MSLRTSANGRLVVTVTDDDEPSRSASFVLTDEQDDGEPADRFTDGWVESSAERGIAEVVLNFTTGPGHGVRVAIPINEEQYAKLLTAGIVGEPHLDHGEPL